MDRTPSDLTGLSLEEVARLGEAHLDGLFGELDATWARIRSNLSPLQMVRRHPVATTAVAAVAGLLLARAIRGRGAAPASAPARQESVGRTFTHSLALALAGAAAKEVPGLLHRGLRRRGGQLGT